MTSADLLLRNARLVRDGAPADPVDMLISAGTIASIGSAEPDGAEVVDLDGRYLMNGLWDHHVHFQQWALSRQHLDLSCTTSAREVADRVRDRLATNPPPAGGALLGYGFRDGLWPDQPLKSLLDDVSGDVPVALASGDLHSGWLNSAAMRQLGAVDRPSGLLRETEFAPVMKLLATAPAVVGELVADAARTAASRGVVGVVDLENARNTEVWSDRYAAGIDVLRVECSVYPENLDWAIAQGLRSGDAVPETGGLMTMGPLKVMTDGSLNTRTAYCHDPYPGMAEDAYGLLVVPPEVLVPLMQRAFDHGITSAIHAIGDHANRLALDAFEKVGCAGTIEHAQLLAPEDFPRFRELGVAASVQPVHALDDRDVADRHWAGRTGRAFAFGGLLAAGAELRLGSDAPVAPLDPWLSAAAAVHRSGDERESWHPEQEIPVGAALDASTRGGRTPRAGAPADLVVLDADPMLAAIDELRAFPVHSTLLAGRWTWRA
ncbi:amidohydrolase family protein [Kribbella sp. NPDC050820]|uniref:amidohydrolase n=1 Tax=Kribbella sp. NPDC050820 TaxID=3155408 RepID=UPI0033D2B61F